jgi:lysophospholipase L1-like esterase
MRKISKKRLLTAFPLVLALLLFILSACKKSPEMPADIYHPPTPVTDTVVTPVPPATTPAPFPLAGKSFLALGDSYTIGQSVTTEERFPYQTARMLMNAGIAVKEPVIIATTGWTTANLLAALNTSSPANNYDVVTLLIGVNNQYQHRSLEEYKTQFTVLLGKAIEYAGNNKLHVFVVSIPDYSVTPFASGSNTAQIAMEIDQFNAACKDITLNAGVHYTDITPISRQGASDPTLQAADGLHPSGKQYARWTELLFPVIKASC